MIEIESVVDAYLATISNKSGGVDGRLGFWAARFQGILLDDITPKQVDAAVTELVKRGKLSGGKGRTTAQTGKPLAPATVDRYIGDLAGLYRYARRHHVVPRDFSPPTTGLSKFSETVHHDRYFSKEQVETLIKVARVTDLHWRKLPALVTLAYSTGLRKSNLTNLRWRDISFEEATIFVGRTKNGDPQLSPLTDTAADELLRMFGSRNPDDYVFASRKTGRPFDFRKVWNRTIKATGIEGLTFHALRHGCGHALAVSGESQSMIMRYMGHKSLTASARYMHASTTDKQRVASKVFG